MRTVDAFISLLCPKDEEAQEDEFRREQGGMGVAGEENGDVDGMFALMTRDLLLIIGGNT